MATRTTYTDSGEMEWQGIGHYRIMLIDKRGNTALCRTDALGTCYMQPDGSIFRYKGWFKVRSKQVYIAKQEDKE